MGKIFAINKAWLGAGFAGLITKMITGAVFEGLPVLGALVSAVVPAATFENIVASAVTAFFVWLIPNG